MFYKKILSVYKCRLQLLTSTKKNVHAFIYTKGKNNCETFLYKKKPNTLKKGRQSALRFYIQKLYTLRYSIFHEIFAIVIYIPKA